MTARSGWVAGISSAALLGLIGVLRPGVALRATLILCLVVAAIALVRTVQLLFARVPPVPDSVIAVPTTDADTPHTVMTDHELPWHYSGLVPSSTNVPVLAPGARTALRTIATERLWARHHVNVWHPPHDEAISELLSERLWAVINPNQRTPPPPDTFQHTFLQQHLDELDGL